MMVTASLGGSERQRLRQEALMRIEHLSGQLEAIAADLADRAAKRGMRLNAKQVTGGLAALQGAILAAHQAHDQLHGGEVTPSSK